MAEEKKTGKRNSKAKRSPGPTPGGGLALRMKYLIISGRDEMKISRSKYGFVEDLTLSGLTFQAPSMKIDDLHISYNDTPAIRNKLTFEIDLPNGRKVTAMGEVSWYERSFATHDKDYHIGVTFKEISEKDRKNLKEYLTAIAKTLEPISLDAL